MKIAIFSDTFPPQTNGVANVVYQSAKSLTDLGHHVAIFTVGKNHRERVVKEGDNLTVIFLPSVPALVYANERLGLPLGFSFKRLKEFRPDIIHTHTPFAVGWEAVWLAKILKIPLVGTHHTFYDHYLKHAKIDYQWAKKFSWKYTVGYYNRCDLILSPTNSLAQTLITKGLKKPVAVLQNPIDTDLFRPVADNKTKKNLKKHFGIKEKSLVYMGRVSYEKSIDQVLKSFALMLKKMPGLQLMLIGDGPERNVLENLAAELAVKNNVIFTGFLFKEELVRALQANDVFLTASKSENMPLSVIESMAVGLPFITVPEKGLAEIIKEGINGFFIPTDNPKAMAEKTLEVLAQPKLIKKLSDGSRSLAMNYSKDNVSALLEKSYEKVLKKQANKN